MVIEETVQGQPQAGTYRRLSRQLIDGFSQTPEPASANKYFSKGKNEVILKKPHKLSKSSKGTHASHAHHHADDEHQRLTFNLEEEVKEYAVSPGTHKPAGKDPFGIQVLQYTDQLWLEHATLSAAGPPNSSTTTTVGSENFPIDFQFCVYDDSEQRILFIKPDNFNPYFAADSKPKNFSVYSALGADLCKLRVTTPLCCTSKKLGVDVTRQGRKLSYIDFYANCIKAYDRKGEKTMIFEIESSGKKNKFRFCPALKESKRKFSYLDPDVEFKCDIFTLEDEKELIGILRQNDDDQQNVVRGEPGGYYCILDDKKSSKATNEDSSPEPGRRSSTPDPDTNIFKLNIVVALLVLMVYLKPNPGSAKVSTQTENDSKNGSGSFEKESGPDKPVKK